MAQAYYQRVCHVHLEILYILWLLGIVLYKYLIDF